MNYFLENVKYNYAYLFIKGDAQGTISGVSNNLGLLLNKIKTGGDEEISLFALTRSVIKGESRIFNEILRIRDENSVNYNGFIQKLRNYIIKGLKAHLEKDSLVDKNVNKVREKLSRA